ncbi:MAG: flagellar biosynthesis protein FlhB [Chloroflexi bacterium]|nr:flagellar biosynthesis protein FlhB [Chloroflexota bacterium]
MPLEERTEAATPRRREEVRQRGQVARSAELTAVCVVLAGVLYLRGNGSTMAEQFAWLMRSSFQRINGPELTPANLADAQMALLLWVVTTFGPPLLILAAAGVGANLVQVGFLFTLHPLAPDFNRVNPVQGFQRIFSGRSLVELLKSLLKLAIAGFVLYRVLASRLPDLLLTTNMSPRDGANLLAAVVSDLALNVTAALFVLAAVDYGYQRYQFEQSIRMTLPEVKEELKQSEGHPQIKARVRQLQRAIAQRRMMAEVPRAAVVITNPTHYAVALRYEPAAMAAPVVVAKGQLLVAQRIKDLAIGSQVPIVENRPLAQTLYRTVEIGDAIPSDLYRAVAEVMAYIFALREGGVRWQ